MGKKIATKDCIIPVEGREDRHGAISCLGPRAGIGRCCREHDHSFSNHWQAASAELPVIAGLL